MPRTLILTRHAKSSWTDPFADDHDRLLNKRGRQSAPAIGEWLSSNGWLPDEVQSSTAIRTRETWDRMGLGSAKVCFTRALYLTGPDEMLQVLSGASGQTVLVLGHNPGVADFARNIVSAAPKHARFHDYPTCATAVIRFDISDWADVAWQSGEVLGFTIPRELLE